MCGARLPNVQLANNTRPIIARLYFLDSIELRNQGRSFLLLLLLLLLLLISFSYRCSILSSLLALSSNIIRIPLVIFVS